MKTPVITIALFTVLLPVSGQSYNAHDVDKLIAFLKQPSYDTTMTNAQALDIAGDIDTFGDWDTVKGLTWTGCPSLIHLDCSENMLTSLDLSGLYQLKVTWMMENIPGMA